MQTKFIALTLALLAGCSRYECPSQCVRKGEHYSLSGVQRDTVCLPGCMEHPSWYRPSDETVNITARLNRYSKNDRVEERSREAR